MEVSERRQVYSKLSVNLNTSQESNSESRSVGEDVGDLKRVLSDETAVISIRVPLAVKLVWSQLSRSEKALVKQILIGVVMGMGRESRSSLANVVANMFSLQNVNMSVNIVAPPIQIQQDSKPSRRRVKRLLERLEKFCNDVLPTLDRLYRHRQLSEVTYRTLKPKLMKLCYDLEEDDS